MKRLVLLGTGTGVGKTHVGAALVGAWRRRGSPAFGLKPVESGISPEESITASDAARLRSGGPVTQAGLHHCALPDPVSPHLAARRVGQRLTLEGICRWVEQSERELMTLHDNAPHAMSLVETAGGALSPLSPGVTCAHLALALAPARIALVAPDALGVLHDVTATLLALSALGCRVDFLVLSGARPHDDSTGTNAAELEGVVLPQLGVARPVHPHVFHLPRGGTDVEAWLDVWSTLR